MTIVWQGLNDLRDGIIRTPLPPKETFNDDPLRVIRCVRFASRFGFEMVPELKEAALDPAIQVGTSAVSITSSTEALTFPKDALSLKISRERIGEELDKMMKGESDTDILCK
jgi:tRNA nucleotidyltransferase (CCA-adding enzyme)